MYGCSVQAEELHDAAHDAACESHRMAALEKFTAAARPSRRFRVRTVRGFQRQSTAPSDQRTFFQAPSIKELTVSRSAEFDSTRKLPI
jgi:hypothetical protein